MGLIAGSDLVVELQRRLTNLSTAHALAALNRAQAWVLRQGSFTFMMTGALTISPVQQGIPNLAAKVGPLSIDMDSGKAKMMFNTDGTPIMHVPWSDFWQSLNYNLPTSTTYDTYTVLNADSGAVHQLTFYFLPNITGTAYLYAHRTMTNLAYSSVSYTELPADFDALLVDLAEAEERRIYDIGDHWPTLLARSQEQIKLLLDGYRSESMQPTQTTDAITKLQETAQTGRA